MRIESSVTSVSWIPPGAVRGYTRLSFDVGFTHYDPTPPDVLGDLEAMRDNDQFRFANELRAWIEVDDGKIVDFGHAGRGVLNDSHVGRGKAKVTVKATPFELLRPDPVVTETSVRFVQTAGGRPGLLAPRVVSGPPYVKLQGPNVWVTLALTINVDGSSQHAVVGASEFPRHWIYDADGKLAAKTGLVGFESWYRHSFGSHSPWGHEADTPALVTAAESALERAMTRTVFSRKRGPRTMNIAKGDRLVTQGELGDELFLVLDGALEVVVNGERVAEVGPGSVLGEQAQLRGGGRRTATLTALTPVRVAVFGRDVLQPEDLQALDRHHSQGGEAAS